MSMLIRSELLKLRTSRTFQWGLVATLLLTALVITQSITAAGRPGGTPLDTAEGVRTVMSAGASGGLLLLVVGILAAAGEFRHGTATATFLITPDRRSVLVAKLTAALLAGLLVALAACAVTLAIGVPWLSAEGVDAGSHAGQVASCLGGSIAATALAGATGVGIGALLRNQTTAVTAALTWTVLIEGLALGFLPELYRWLPGGAAAALTGAPATGETLPLWGGLLLSVGYALALATAGTYALQRRDVA